MTLSVFYCADEVFAHSLQVSLFSLFRHHPRGSIRLYLFDGGLSVSSRDLVKRLAHAFGNELVWLGETDSARVPLLAKSRYAPISCARLLCASLIPERHVLYVDADTLFLGPIEELWRFCVGADVKMGAVRDFLSNFRNIFLDADPYVTAQRFRSLERIGVADEERYFNTGLMWFDVPYLRAIEMEKKIRELAEVYPDFAFLADQNYLNLLFRGNWTELDYSWNFQIPLENFLNGTWAYRDTVNYLSIQPKILHFVSVEKPWLGFGHKPFAHLFFEEASLLEDHRRTVGLGRP